MHFDFRDYIRNVVLSKVSRTSMSMLMRHLNLLGGALHGLAIYQAQWGLHCVGRVMRL